MHFGSVLGSCNASENIEQCYRPMKTLDFTSVCNKRVYLAIKSGPLISLSIKYKLNNFLNFHSFLLLFFFFLLLLLFSTSHFTLFRTDFEQVMIVCVWLVGIPGSVLSIAAVLKFKKLRTAGNIFVTNLSISDSLYYSIGLSIRLALFQIGKGGLPWPEDRFSLLCTFFGGFSHFLNGISVTSLCAIAMNRLLFIQHSRYYKLMYSRRGLTFQIGSIWTASFTITLALPMLGIWGGYDYHAPVRSCTLRPCADTIFKIVIVTIGFWIPASFIIVCYSLIYKHYRASQKRVKTWARKSSTPAAEAGASVSEKSEANSRSTSLDDDRISASNYRRSIALDRNINNKGNSIVLEEYISEVNNQITEKNFSETGSWNSLRMTAPSTDPCASLLARGRRLSTLSETSFTRSNSLTCTSNETTKEELVLDSTKLSLDSNNADNGTNENQHQNNDTAKPVKTQIPLKKVAFEEEKMSERPPILVMNRDKRQSNASTASKWSLKSTRSRMKKVKFTITSKQQKEAIIMSVMILCIFILFSICILPYFIVIIVNPNMENPDAYLIALMFTWFNGCINPAIYALMNTQYRSAYKALLKAWFGWMYCQCRRVRPESLPVEENLHRTATHM